MRPKIDAPALIARLYWAGARNTRQRRLAQPRNLRREEADLTAAIRRLRAMGAHREDIREMIRLRHEVRKAMRRRRVTL